MNRLGAENTTMKARAYEIVVRHHFFLTATLLASSIYTALGVFKVGMSGYFLGAAIVAFSTRNMETK